MLNRVTSGCNMFCLDPLWATLWISMHAGFSVSVRHDKAWADKNASNASVAYGSRIFDSASHRLIGRQWRLPPRWRLATPFSSMGSAGLRAAERVA